MTAGHVAETGGGKAKRGRPPKPKQTEIPGTERQRIPEIDEIAEEYANKRDEWQGMGKELEALKEQLHGAMRNHGLKIYVLEGSEEYEKVELVAGDETVKVRRKKGRPRKTGDEDGSDDD
jgi:hypothetical protein